MIKWPKEKRFHDYKLWNFVQRSKKSISETEIRNSRWLKIPSIVNKRSVTKIFARENKEHRTSKKSQNIIKFRIKRIKVWTIIFRQKTTSIRFIGNKQTNRKFQKQVYPKPIFRQLSSWSKGIEKDDHESSLTSCTSLTILVNGRIGHDVKTISWYLVLEESSWRYFTWV